LVDDIPNENRSKEQSGSDKSEIENTRKENGESQKKRTSSRLWTPYGDPLKERIKGSGRTEESRQESTEAKQEEELRKGLEEALEKITVADVIIDVMVSLASLAYQRMGIPKDVNEKYKDLEQARLAIDCLDSLAKTVKGRVAEDAIKSIESTIDNLKLNYAKLT